MRQVYNGLYRYLGYFNAVSHCELKVYVHDKKHEAVVIFCEVPSNQGTSVTNAAEHLASVVHEKVIGYNYKPESVTWVEHYPDSDTFDLVSFKTSRPYTMPAWTRSSREEVEKLVGVPVEVRHLERTGRKPA